MTKQPESLYRVTSDRLDGSWDSVTWQDLVDACSHSDAIYGGDKPFGELRELGGGEVVSDSWDPTDGDPEIIARLAE